MTIFGPNGLDIPTLAEIIDDFVVRFKAKLGDDIRVEDVDGVYGRINVIISRVKSDILAELEATVAGLLPSTSSGVLLEELVKFNGLTKNVATRSVVDSLQLVANDAGTTILAGDLVGTRTGIQFALDVGHVLAPNETKNDVSATAVEEGAFPADANTITQILTPRKGWASVTNLTDATPGNAVEQDPALRIRRWRAALAVGLHHPSIIEKVIADLDGVTDVHIEVNNGTTANENGVPPQHIRAIVIGGTDQDIADTLFGIHPLGDAYPQGAGSIGAGIGSYGGTGVAVSDPETSQTDTIYFQRGLTRSIYITVQTVINHRVYPTNGSDLIKQSILEFFEGNLEINDVPVDPFRLGDDVVSPRLYTPANAVPGHSIRSILIGFTANPTSSDDLPIATHEIAKTALANIKVEPVG